MSTSVLIFNTPTPTGIRTSTQVGDLVAAVSATDLDVGDNGRFEYRLDAIRLFRPGVQGSVRPVPSPFNISADGHITAAQLMAQYDHARFELQVAAKEVASPFRVAKAIVKVRELVCSRFLIFVDNNGLTFSLNYEKK